ncbi:MAG: hypothetical protein QG597_5268 [Actinomycetota bacterium]|nr:hypothetical protein [Actinomycetota bacterium]
MGSKVAVAAVTLGISALVAACGAGTSTTSESPSVALSSAESSATTSAPASVPPSAEPVPTPEATTPSAPEINLPQGPEPGTPSAVAWEALMGPDGEYAAAASYAAVIDAFGEVQPYVDIKAAEERHINALVRQLNRLGVEAPPNPYLGNLAAPDKLESAAQAWAEGEILNVAMYDSLLTQTDDSSLLQVLQNLRRASLESHLPLFEAAAASGGTLTTEQMANVQGAS